MDGPARGASLVIEPACPADALSPARRLDQAVVRLERFDPALSARTGLWRAQRRWLTAGVAASATAVFTAPQAFTLALEGALAVVFALLLAVRLLAIRHVLTAPRQAGAVLPPEPDLRSAPQEISAHVPVYTVLIALYREAEIVPQLLAALDALDYPAAKLEIIFALEEDDLDTWDALAAQRLPAHMRVVRVPDGCPRTKPRALCHALTFARGDYVVVYDAEDLPDRDQLTRAIAAFAAAGVGNLGCLQASLAVNNARQSWLTAQFAIEYTALFDAVLPALARYRLPVPLGGTSNHFPGIR